MIFTDRVPIDLVMVAVALLASLLYAYTLVSDGHLIARRLRMGRGSNRLDLAPRRQTGALRSLASDLRSHYVGRGDRAVRSAQGQAARVAEPSRMSTTAAPHAILTVDPASGATEVPQFPPISVVTP